MVKERFKKQLWISAGIIVLGVAIAAAALVFFSNDIAAQAKAITAARALVESKTDEVADLAALESGAPQAAQYQAAIDQLLPDQYSLVTFPQWLAALGGKYNVTTDATLNGSVVAPGAGIPGNEGFTFSAEGSPDDLTAFLDDMNTKATGFLMSITSFSVANDGTNETMTGQGTLFFR
jgi:hypothetical protein